ncbi:MAG: hypothetical protein AB1640_24915 [bacterium]
MLEIRVIMNSPVEEILAFKCCHMLDLNLELHLKNTGPVPVSVPSSCELVNDQERLRIDYLYPQGGYSIQPGEIVAFYCSLDDAIFDRFRAIVFRDGAGREHTASLKSAGGPQSGSGAKPADRAP